MKVEIEVELCWCVPPGVLYAKQDGVSCNWPNCLQGDKPNPKQNNKTLEIEK